MVQVAPRRVASAACSGDRMSAEEEFKKGLLYMHGNAEELKKKKREAKKKARVR